MPKVKSVHSAWLALRIQPELLRLLRQTAFAERSTLSDWVRSRLEAALLKEARDAYITKASNTASQTAAE
jgi:hypothetical protein